MRAAFRGLTTPSFATEYLLPQDPDGRWAPLTSVVVRYFGLPPPSRLGPARAILAAAADDDSLRAKLRPLLLPVLVGAMPELAPTAALLLAPMVEAAWGA